MMEIRPVQTGDERELIRLIAAFRASLAELRGNTDSIDLAAAAEELAEYADKAFPIYVAVRSGATSSADAASDAAALAGYLVCRVEGDVVWAESLYVEPEYRRLGVGSALYARAERLAQELGGDTLYHWVDPTNEKIIRFLQKRGYNVLNLIELRRPRPGEELTHKINVGAHQFTSLGDQSPGCETDEAD